MTRQLNFSHEVCFSRQVLADFALGKLPDAELERIAREVENCPTCNAVLQTLDGLEDSVVGDLKKELPSFSDQPSPELERRLQRAETLGRELWRTQSRGPAAQPGEIDPSKKRDRPSRHRSRPPKPQTKVQANPEESEVLHLQRE